jgi:predicted HicB family RNase H-like nuclease
MAKKKAKTGGRPRKPPESTKSRYLQVRVQEVEHTSFAAAAELSGLDVSAWVRTTLRAAARKQLEGFGESVPFLDK